MYNIGIDLGGTNIVVGVVDKDNNIVGKAERKTNIPRPAENIFEDMYAAALDALDQAGLSMKDVEYVGLGTPGAVEPETGVITYSANLFFHNVKAKEILEERFGKMAFVGNDANCAAYGEYIAGAGKFARDMIAVTLGTGVGGGIIIDEKLLVGFNGAAGEIGHMVIHMDGESCNCGRSGCWESYASATALIRMTKELSEKGDDPILQRAIEKEGEINAKVAYAAARAGSKQCAELCENYAKYIATGVVNLINMLQPEVICIGGGVSHEGDALLEPVKRYIAEQSYTRDNSEEMQTVIKLAELGNDAGIIGAALLNKNG
ncbi:MAG: ROK family glucokinase [Clostridia bacterium]|nr:ROK family glucokinase [Clostridia bacterium]